MYMLMVELILLNSMITWVDSVSSSLINGITRRFTFYSILLPVHGLFFLNI